MFFASFVVVGGSAIRQDGETYRVEVEIDAVLAAVVAAALQPLAGRVPVTPSAVTPIDHELDIVLFELLSELRQQIWTI